jgi:hypothetical protein
MGNTNALKKGDTPGCRVDKLLKSHGVDLAKNSPKMEHYTSILDWNADSMTYMAAKVAVMKEFNELAYTLGGKALEIQDEITKLSMFLNIMEKKMLEDGNNPLESKEYLNALKLKKDYIIEKNKLNIDYGKAATDYAIKRKNNPDAFDEDAMW